MNALRPANANTQGVPYRCLDFATRVFNVPNKYDFAWQAWSNAQYRHPTSESLPDVPVPVWFEWTGLVDNVRANWGHVAVWFPGKGVLSSPFSINQKQQWFDTPQKLITYLGSGSYVGWSEDINGVRIADVTKEDDMTTQEAIAMLDSYWWNIVGRKIKQSELDEYVPVVVSGNPDKVFKKSLTWDETKAHLAQYATGAPELNNDLVFSYLEKHLK
jgi:hypothetical protein